MSNNEPANEASPSQPDQGTPAGASPGQSEPFGAHIERENELETAREAQAEIKRSSAHPLAPDPVTPSVESRTAEISAAGAPRAEELAHELASSPLFADAPASATPTPHAPPATSFAHSAPPPAPPPPRPIVEEVTAVRVSRFEAPAPTIDVTAQRATPPPAREVPPAAARATSASQPAAAGAASTASGATTGAAATGASGAGGSSVPPNTATSAAAASADSSGRFWSAVCHLMMIPATLTIYLGGVITFFLWQIAGREDPLAEDQGREALNFQINVAVLSALLAFSCFGSPLLIVLVPASWVICVIAAIRAAKGERYRYPMIWRIVSH